MVLLRDRLHWVLLTLGDHRVVRRRDQAHEVVWVSSPGLADQTEGVSSSSRVAELPVHSGARDGEVEVELRHEPPRLRRLELPSGVGHDPQLDERGVPRAPLEAQDQRAPAVLDDDVRPLLWVPVVLGIDAKGVDAGVDRRLAGVGERRLGVCAHRASYLCVAHMNLHIRLLHISKYRA